MSNQYQARDIEVLSGLEPVQRRPGMYTDTSRPNHLIQEVIDNSVDEALAGFCRSIDVSMHEDGSIEVADDGHRSCGRCPDPEGGAVLVDLGAEEVSQTVMSALGEAPQIQISDWCSRCRRGLLRHLVTIWGNLGTCLRLLLVQRC